MCICLLKYESVYIMFFCNLDGGVVYCVYLMFVGSNYYVIVVNVDSIVDFMIMFWFICYVSIFFLRFGFF